MRRLRRQRKPMRGGGAFTVGAACFAVCRQKIPCSRCREFVQRNLTVQWVWLSGEAALIEIPRIFPDIREILGETRSPQLPSTAT